MNTHQNDNISDDLLIGEYANELRDILTMAKHNIHTCSRCQAAIQRHQNRTAGEVKA